MRRYLPAVGVVIGLWRAGLEVQPIGVGQPAGAVDTSVVAALAQTSALPGTLRIVMTVVALGSVVVVILIDVVMSRSYRAGLGFVGSHCPFA